MSEKQKDTSPTLSQRVAGHVVRTGYGDLTPTAIAWAKNSIIDTLGVALAGSDQDNAKIVAQVFTGSHGNCVLYGMKKRAAALDAAMINGTSSHVLDFDASNDTFAGHPSVHILPAIWAIGEERNLTGRDLIAAHAMGFEVQSRLGRMVQPVFGDKGWFPSSSLGVMGSAAAVAHMLKLDEKTTTNAFGIAAMFASGFMANAGTMTKPVSAGQGARNGLLAALLAEKGLDSATNALEDRRGFFALFETVPSKELVDNALAGWGHPYEVEETAIGLKRHPCCGVLQSTIDVAVDLAKDNDIKVDQIEGMDILLMTSRFGHVDRPHPKSGIDAKFSVQYCLARAVQDKGVGIADFESGGYEDAGVAALMTKVNAAVNPSMQGLGRAQQGGADITIRLKDGRKFHGARSKPLGREAGKPLSDRMIDDKFRDCATRTLKRDGIEPLVSKLRGLETQASIKQLSDFLFEITA